VSGFSIGAKPVPMSFSVRVLSFSAPGRQTEIKSGAMTILKADIFRTSIAFAYAGVLFAVLVAPTAATPISTHIATRSSIDARGPIAVRWRGRARGPFEDALIARAIAGGALADPGPLYGRYLGPYGYPGHYPCCYYPQVFDRIYYPYYYLSRAGFAHPTWWDYPVHWQGW